MKLISLGCAATTAALLLVSAATAAPPAAPPASLSDFLKPLLILPADDGGAWDDLDKVPAVRWSAPGPTMTDKPSPDGNYFARVGLGSMAGRPLQVAATGARSMVFSYYIRDAAPAGDPEALAAELRGAGFTVTPARCAAASPRRWYRLALARKKPAFLVAGPTKSGGTGYTLYLHDLPPLEPGQVAPTGGRCPGQ